MLLVLATAVSMALLPGGVAAASITLFEPPLFHPGSVNGQSGVGGFPWKSAPTWRDSVGCNPTPTYGQYDQEVVADSGAPPGDPPGFGSQSLRMSNALCDLVSSSTRRIRHGSHYRSARARLNKVFLAEFAFMSTTPAYQPGLFMSVSPDSGEGSRMSWVGLEDTPDGIQVSVTDAPDVDGKFVAHTLPAAWPQRSAHDQVLDQGQPRPGQRPRTNLHRRCGRWSVLHDVGELLPHRSGAGAAAEPQYARGHQQPAVPLQRAGAPWPRRWWLPVRQREYHSE